MSDETNPPRRRFLKIACGACTIGIAGAVGAPVLGAFLAPSDMKTVSGGGEPLDFGKVGDLADGVPQKRDVVAERRDAWDRFEPAPLGAIWLVRRGDQVIAYSAVCPHLGCSIGYDAERKLFYSPCHDSAFALDDGHWLKGPAPRGMDPLPLEIKDGRIRVTYKKFVLGIKERKEA
jgi:Rieske Fe-S protein